MEEKATIYIGLFSIITMFIIAFLFALHQGDILLNTILAIAIAIFLLI